MRAVRWLQSQHYEYRYLIPGDLGESVRDFVRQYLVLDEHSVGRPDFSYLVHDYYLDSTDWRVYWRTVDVAARNSKLRLRWYSQDPGQPVYVETKRRQADLVEKHSVGVPRSALEPLLNGQLPDLSELPMEPASRGVLERFCQRVTQFQARPRVHVSYGREAWVSEEKDLRVRMTVDRRVEAGLVRELSFSGPVTEPVGIYGKQMVLELKFADRFPGWFRDLINRFNFKPSGAVKFATSVQQLAGPSVSGSETSFF